MQTKRFIASGLIAIMALSPLLSSAATYRYNYSLTALADAKGGNNGGGEVDPENPNPEDGYETFVSEWEDVGQLYDCTEPSPSADTIPSGISFVQKWTCSVDQERQIIKYKLDPDTNTPILIGDPKIEKQTLTGIEDSAEAEGTNPAFSILFDAPKVATTEVFLGWQSNGATNYKIKGSSAESGVPTTYQDVGRRTYSIVYPSAPGTYTYTLMATNSAGETTEAQAQVQVIDFSITDFVVQESEVPAGGDIHLSWNAPAGANLTLYGYGDVTGKSSIVIQAPNNSGTHNWTLHAEKEINGELVTADADSNYYEIIGTPVIYESVSPKVDKFFANGNSLTLSWASYSQIQKYTIQSDNENSGIPTSPVEVATTGAANAVSKQVAFPTAGEYGKYTYTIKGYNKAGIAGELKIVATAVPSPTIYYADPSKSRVSPGETVTLEWNTIGVSSIEIKDRQTKQVVYSGSGTGNTYSNMNSVAVPVGTTLGNVYWDIVVKGFNGSSASKAAFTYVVADPVLNITAPTADVHLGNKFRVDTQIQNADSVTMTGSSTESGWSPSGTTESGTSSYYEGTPTAAGDYTYTITATNSAGKSVSKTFTVHVLPW